MTLNTDAAHLIYSMRRAMVGLEDPLLARVVAVPLKSDNDYILTAAGAAPLLRPRERRKKERAVAALAALVNPRPTKTPLALADGVPSPPASVADVSAAAAAAASVDILLDADATALHAQGGLLWSSDSARVSESRLSWAVSGINHPAAAAIPSNNLTVEQINQKLIALRDEPVILQPRGGYVDRAVERNQLEQQQQQPIARVPYSRVSVGARRNISVVEKPNLADLQKTPPANVPELPIPGTISEKGILVDLNGNEWIDRPAVSNVPANSMFAKSNAVAAAPVVKKSALALLLNDQGATENPFADEYGFLSGKGDAYPTRIKIYIPTSPTPFDPLLIIIKRDACIEELIGYTLYEYFNKLSSNTTEYNISELLPEEKCNVWSWNLRLVEDDGTIDDDFPALDRTSKMEKANFQALALCLCTPAQVLTNQAARRARPMNNRRTPSNPVGGSSRSNPLSFGSGNQSMSSASRPHGGPAPLPLHRPPALPTGVPNGGVIASGPGGSAAVVSAGPPPILSDAPITHHTSQTTTSKPIEPRFNNRLIPAVLAGGNELSPSSNGYLTNPGGPQKPQIFVKIHLYSTLEVKHTATFAFSGGMTMGQVFEQICAKRKYDSDNYVLKMGDTKTDVALDRLLEDMHALEFCVLKKDRGGAGDIFLRPPDEVRPAAERDQLDFTPEEIATIYRQYNVTQKQLLMSRTSERVITLDGEFIHIMSVGDLRSVIDSAKTMTYHISSIVSCSLLKKQSRQFKLVVATASRTGNAATTNSIDFEAGSEMQAADLCARVAFMIQLNANLLGAGGNLVAVNVAAINGGNAAVGGGGGAGGATVRADATGGGVGSGDVGPS
ncbi:stress-activated map kinase interacting protein 1-domain-containing protein [Obelidium mucronatum]|nr:stress-activated map kinase interacting protein 1-domain-containing protein [Obelidium mucronatum]